MTSPSLMQAAEHLRDTATHTLHRLSRDLEGGFGELNQALRTEVDGHPIRSVLIAAGVGYVLGGGLARPLSRQLGRLVIRAAVLPFLEEPVASLWQWMESDATQEGAAPSKPGSGAEPEIAKGAKHHGN